MTHKYNTNEQRSYEHNNYIILVKSVLYKNKTKTCKVNENDLHVQNSS